MKLGGRVVELEGKHYLVVEHAGIVKAFPLKRKDDGDWELDLDSIGGVWSEQKPNAQGGTDCVVHIPCFEIQTELKQPQ